MTDFAGVLAFRSTAWNYNAPIPTRWTFTYDSDVPFLDRTYEITSSPLS